MDELSIIQLLENAKNEEISVEQAVSQLKRLPFEKVGDFANVDLHRSIRCGFPEVILGSGKSLEQIIQIVQKLRSDSDHLLITRLSPERAVAILKIYPDMVYHEQAQILALDKTPSQKKKPGISVLTGGTADIPVAEEAAVTAETMGNQVTRLYDVGIAGLHRLLAHIETIQQSKVIIAVAGMEGALPSVVAGLVSVPVIAVPTSIGYGASFQGLSALLTMLNSCANGISVVNIDNGYGAGYQASLINRLEPSE